MNNIVRDDDGDEDEDKKKETSGEEDRNLDAGEYDLGDIGTLAGEHEEDPSL